MKKFMRSKSSNGMDDEALIDDDDETSDEFEDPTPAEDTPVDTPAAKFVDANLAERAIKYAPLAGQSGSVRLKSVSSMSDIGSKGAVCAVGGRGGFAVINSDAKALKGPELLADVQQSQAPGASTSYHRVAMATSSSGTSLLVVWLTSTSGTMYHLSGAGDGEDKNVKQHESKDRRIQKEVRLYAFSTPSSGKAPSVGKGVNVPLQAKTGDIEKIYYVAVSPSADRFAIAFLTKPKSKLQQKLSGSGQKSDVKLTLYKPTLAGSSVVNKGAANEMNVPQFVRDLDSAVITYANQEKWLVLAANQGVRGNNKRELFVYSSSNKGSVEDRKDYIRRVIIEHEVTCMDFNEDDSLLAVGMAAGYRVELVSTKEWEVKYSIALESAAVWSIAFSHPPRDKDAAAATSDDMQDVEKASRGRQLFACMGTTVTATKQQSAAASSAAAYVCDFDRKEALAKLHQLPTSQGTNEHVPLAKVCSFTRDGHLLTATTKGELVKYDLMTDRQERGTFATRSKVTAFAVSMAMLDNSRWIATAYAWNVGKTKQTRLELRFIPGKGHERGSNGEFPSSETKNFDYPHEEEIVKLVFSPDGRSLAIAQAWGGGSSDKVRRSKVHVRALNKDSNGKADSGGAKGVNAKWDITVKAAEESQLLTGEVQDLKFGPRGRELAVVTEDTLAVYNVDAAVHRSATLMLRRARPKTWMARVPRIPELAFLKKTETYDELKLLVRQSRLDLGGGDDVKALAGSNRGDVVAVGGEKVIVFVDVESKESIGRTEMPGEVVIALAFSSDDALLAAGGHAGGVYVIDVMTHMLVKRCGKREYPPRGLSFSPDSSVLLDTNKEKKGTLFSIDGTEQALVNPVDLSAMLAAKMDGGKRRFDLERAANLGALVKGNLGLSSTILPRKSVEDGGHASQPTPAQSDRRGSAGARAALRANRAPVKESGQWLKDDVASKLREAGLDDPNSKCRMLDVLVSQRERAACEEVLKHAPALPLVPHMISRLGRRGTPMLPSFNIAARVRAHHVLKSLLHASARAPVLLRATVAKRVLPYLVSAGMVNTVSDFFSELELEMSNASIGYAVDKNGRPLTRDETMIMYPTWGGEGSLVWLEYDPDPTRHRAAKALKNRGVGAEDPASVRAADETVVAPAWTGSCGPYYVAFMRGLLVIRKLIAEAFEWLIERWESFVLWWKENVRLATLSYLLQMLVYYVFSAFHWCADKTSEHLPDRTVGGVTLPPFMRGSRDYVEDWVWENEPIEPTPPEKPDPDEERPGKSEVTALRVGLPHLSSKHFLYMIRDLPEGGFDNQAIGKTVKALWTNHFFALHVIKSLLVLATAVGYMYFVIHLHQGHRSATSEAALLSDETESVAHTMATMGRIILVTLFITFVNSALQLYGAIEAYDDLVEGLVSGTFEFLFNPWNLFDIALVISLSWATFGEMYDTLPLYSVEEGKHYNVAGLLALSGLFLLVRVVQVLRGFELTGWLIMALIQNLRDMLGFIVVLSTIIVFFASSFLTLFPFESAVVAAARRLAEVGADGAADAAAGAADTAAGAAAATAMDTGAVASELAAALEKQPEGFGSFKEALLVTFNMGIFGDFDTDQFEASINPDIFRVLFVGFMLIVGVVALNALIALLGDSYAHVQEQRAEQTLRLYATCIVEYYNTMGPLLRLRRERTLAWTHVLRVGTEDNEEVAGREWAGQLTIIKREIADKTSALKEEVVAMDAKVSDIVKVVHGIDKKVNEEKLARERAAREAKEAAERKQKEEEEERLRRADVGNSRNEIASVAGSDTANLSDLEGMDSDSD